VGNYTKVEHSVLQVMRESLSFGVKNTKFKNCTSSLAILALPEENWFETQAIEAYLIEKLKPPNSTVGKW
jgi:hypothetical protein